MVKKKKAINFRADILISQWEKRTEMRQKEKKITFDENFQKLADKMNKT